MSSLTPFRLGVDTLGSETPTREILFGVEQFSAVNPECQLCCIGRRTELQSTLTEPHTIVHCDEAVAQHEPLSDVVRDHRRSSMRIGLEMLAQNHIDAFVSTGNTAALMAVGRQVLPMLDGVLRPAFIKQFEGKAQPFWMLDLGANIVCKPALLLQFAQMGSSYASAISGLVKPRVALLNIGSEAHKGPLVLRDTAHQLSHLRTVSFVGFIEADRLFDGDADVVVTDGFSGNLALKSLEGAATITRHFMLNAVREAALDKHEVVQQVTQHVDSRLNAQSYNGASLIGLNGVVVKSHGRSDRIGIVAALNLARDEYRASIPSRLVRQYPSSRGHLA